MRVARALLGTLLIVIGVGAIVGASIESVAPWALAGLGLVLGVALLGRAVRPPSA